jgi:putative transposase
MSRPWRIEFEGAVYHVTARGNNRQAIFLSDDDRKDFLDLVGRAARRFSLDIFSYCLMTNHYHLFLRTPLGNLSKAMHWLNGSYTTHFNRGHRRIGHLFQGRYKAVMVADEAHWLHLSMYIHLNPVRARVFEDPGKYKWSSFRDYTRPKSRFEWLFRDEILSNYGRTNTSRYRRYRRECLALAGTKPDFVEQLKSGVILGSREKIQELAKKYRPTGKVGAVSDYSMAARSDFDPGRELRRVSEVFGVKVEDLRKRHRNFPAKLAAYYHLVENCGMSVTETAGELAVGITAVTLGIKALKELLSKDRKLRSRISQLTKN